MFESNVWLPISEDLVLNTQLLAEPVVTSNGEIEIFYDGTVASPDLVPIINDRFVKVPDMQLNELKKAEIAISKTIVEAWLQNGVKAGTFPTFEIDYEDLDESS